ncbi:MAG: hypothetical protein WA081_14310 [Desulfosalsimonadaceae bacterium]
MGDINSTVHLAISRIFSLSRHLSADFYLRDFPQVKFNNSDE